MTEATTLVRKPIITARLWDHDWNQLASLPNCPDPITTDDLVHLTISGPNPLADAARTAPLLRNIHLTFDDSDGRTHVVVEQFTITDTADCKECGASKPTLTVFIGRVA